MTTLISTIPSTRREPRFPVQPSGTAITKTPMRLREDSALCLKIVAEDDLMYLSSEGQISSAARRTSVTANHSEHERVFNLLQRLAELYSLPEDWDSYDSQPISDEAIGNTIVLFSRLIDFYRTSESAYPTWIGPIPSGGIELVWKKGESELEIDIGPEGDSEYLLVRGSGSERSYHEGEADSVSSLVELIVNFFSE